jgi:single-stranded-DNA-specific exonuclease
MVSPQRVQLRAFDPALAEELAQQLQLTPILGQLLAQRQLGDPEAARSFLYDEASQVCADPFLLADMDKAVVEVQACIDEGRKIFIHGDYDVDGVCSTVILVEGLQALGAQLEHHVPDRFSEGYGVSITAVEGAAQRGCTLLLTCDCGSSSWAAVARAKELGMRVVVTDHHSLPAEWPQADALVNPQRRDCQYPFKSLCGAALAYKLLCALQQKQAQPWPTHFLDLVALATIADVMPLLGENRAVVRTGLRQLAQLERPGLRALAQVAGVEKGPWGSFAVGFGLGPRINAAGRLEHARLAVDLLLCQDTEQAHQKATYLDHLNLRRRDLELSMRTQVEERLESDPSLLELGVVVESGTDWHQGVVGITASRVVDRYGLPAFIMGQVGEVCKGSARAPENVPLFEAMQQCADVFIKFGGHARAAGFTVAADRVDEMRVRLSAAIAKLRQGLAPIHVDLELNLHQANLDLAQQLKRLEPLGEGNRTPVFLARRVRLEHPKIIGKSQEHMRLRLIQGACERKAVAFRMADQRSQILEKQLHYDVLFELEEEVWEGHSSASLRIQALLEPEPQVFSLLRGQPQWRPHQGRPVVVDARAVTSRRGYVEALCQQGIRPLVVVRGPAQRQKVADALSGVEISLYEHLPTGYEDLVLVYPPACGSHLQLPVLQQATRLHILFGSQELLQEAKHWLDRPGLECIWKALTQHARQGRLEHDSIEKEIRPRISGLDRALEVFEELELVERKPEGWLLRPSQGRRLEDSRRYQEICRGRENYMQMVHRFADRHLRLEESLAAQ